MSQSNNARWFLEPFKKYAQFTGRARRKEFWWFSIFNSAICFVLGFIEGMMGIAAESQFSILAGIYSLAVLVPSLAVTVRRLHDTNRSGWWCCIALLPIVGSIVLLVFTVQDSMPGTNRFGPNPKTPATSGTGMYTPPASRPVRPKAA